MNSPGGAVASAAPKEHGPGVRVNGSVIAGRGRCYANTPLEQDCVYFEVRIVDADPGAANVTVGCGRRASDESELDKPLGATPQSHGAKFGGGGHCSPIRPGDVIGCAFDQDSGPVHMKFWYNGEPVRDAELRGMKGEQWPALSVESCTVHWALGETELKHRSCVPARFAVLIGSTALIQSA